MIDRKYNDLNAKKAAILDKLCVLLDHRHGNLKGTEASRWLLHIRQEAQTLTEELRCNYWKKVCGTDSRKTIKRLVTKRNPHLFV